MLGRFLALLALGAFVAAPLAHQQQAKADDHEVVIGFAIALSGWMNQYDGPPYQGSLMAIEEFNAQGGILGKQIRAVVADTKTDTVQGAKAGADPAMIFEVVNSGWGQSFMLGRNAPVMLDRDFEGTRTQMTVFLKDMGLIKELTTGLGMETPSADLAHDAIRRTVDQGLGDKDSAAVVLPMEQDAGCEIRRREYGP